MGDVAIRVEGLGKQYRLGGAQERYSTLRDQIHRLTSVRRLLRRARRTEDRPALWALKDVSFYVRPGEVVGIIGRNGAGKSTLLKILSRITEPTEGVADIRGRLGSLLEVGTGFHPELTGRENVYLNGAILGMRRAEIARKFDEIISFAEVDKFVDTPVKHYSSGMYTRLAFAVAAHLEPEILVVDEVLAVGDASFQKKCLQKMRQAGAQGRTILFVSHNMAAMRSICTSGMLLDRGAIVRQGEINDVADHYLARLTEKLSAVDTVETPSFLIHEVELTSPNGSVIKTFDPVTIRVRLTAKVSVLDPGLYLGILTTDQQRLAGLDFKDFGSFGPLHAGEQIEAGFTIVNLPLLAGTYQLDLHLKEMAAHRIEPVPRPYYFDVAETPVYGGRKTDAWFGHVGLKAQSWHNKVGEG